MSQEVPDEIREKVDELAEEKGIDEDRARSRYMEVVEEVQEYDSNIPDERVFRIAFSTFSTDVIGELASGGEETEIVGVGQSGFQNWSRRDNDGNLVDENGNIVDSKDDAAKKDVLVAFGVIPREGVKGGRAPCVFIMDETDNLDIDHFATLFDPGTALKGRFNISESDDLKEHFVAFGSSYTDVEEVEDPQNIPDTEEERMEWVRDAADDAEIANIADSLSSTNSDGYTSEFGIDFKRIEGNIVDLYKNDVEGTYIYTLLDDSVIQGEEEKLIAADVMDGDSEGRTPGLTCWANANVMEYGEGSYGEFFGSVSRSDEGRITMDLYGVNPTFARDLDDGSEGSEEGGENVDSMTL